MFNSFVVVHHIIKIAQHFCFWTYAAPSPLSLCHSQTHYLFPTRRQRVDSPPLQGMFVYLYTLFYIYF